MKYFSDMGLSQQQKILKAVYTYHGS